MAIGNHHVVHRTRGTSWASPSNAGLVLGVAGIAGIVASMLMSWRAGDQHPSEIPASFLWDRFATSDPSMLIWLVPIAVVAAIGVLIPGATALRAIAGLAMLVVCALFAWQLHRLADRFGVSLGDSLDPGFYVGAIGGFVLVLSAFFPSGWFGRSSRSEYVDDNRDVYERV
jgi:hypothetical protein